MNDFIMHLGKKYFPESGDGLRVIPATNFLGVGNSIGVGFNDNQRIKKAVENKEKIVMFTSLETYSGASPIRQLTAPFILSKNWYAPGAMLTSGLGIQFIFTGYEDVNGTIINIGVTNINYISNFVPFILNPKERNAFVICKD